MMNGVRSAMRKAHGIAKDISATGSENSSKTRGVLKAWVSERFELSRGGGPGNIRPMEGLRGFAALLVFFAHYIGFMKPFIDQSSGFAAAANAVNFIGNSGVDLFFVLSGYLIYGSLISRPQLFTQFMSRRVARIYPVFIVMFAVYIVLSLLLPNESKIPTSAGEAAAFLFGNFFLLAGLFPFTVMISVAWSLSYEMFYYAVIPAIISVFKLRQKSAGWRVGFFVVVALAYTAFCFVYWGRPRLLMFVAGILLYEAINHLRLRAPGSMFTVVVVSAALLLQLSPVTNSVGNTLQVVALFVAYFILCFCCFADTGAWLRRVFEWSPLRWFGNMSYSFYMVHALAMQFAVLVLATFLPASSAYGPLLFWAFMPALFVTALVPAVLMYLFVERRFSLKPTRTPDDGPVELPKPAPLRALRVPFGPSVVRARSQTRTVYADRKRNPEPRGLEQRGTDRD